MNRLLARAAPLVAALVLGCTSDFGGKLVPAPPLPESVARVAGRVPSGDERAVLRDKGLVIATSVPVRSFHLGYTALFKAHQPMYFTADALLHALHCSYDAILADIETDALVPELGALLAELRAGLARSTAFAAETRADLDLHLAVAESLLTGTPAAPVAGASVAEIARLLTAVNNASGISTVTLFGEPAELDLSQMKPRGHYTTSVVLTRYFCATMWLGRTEIRIAKKVQGAWRVNRRALDAALLLRGLLSSRAEQAFRRLDEATRTFVGPADSMSFPGLTRAARAAGLARPELFAGLGDAEVAGALEREASPRIGSRLLHPGDEAIDFLVLGQRYVFDSEVLSTVTHGRLPVKRMMPSPLDVAWGVFKNPAAVPLLEPEIGRYRYRDALEAVAARGDEMGPELWEGSLYHLWLGALRALSPEPRRDAGLPAVMRTDAWARRIMSTQLASWAELRHDTVLYAKQSYSAMAICEYPDAYVEPYPDFFRAIEKLASRGGALVASLDFGARTHDRTRIARWFERLGEAAATLREMAELERQSQPFRSEHLDFINKAVSYDGRHAGCTMTWEPGGWYADLHYDRADVTRHKPTIADVHTQPTDEVGNPVGKVLHVGTGSPRPFTVTIETCKGPRTYHGFVSAYHEVVTRDFERLDDDQWAERSKSAPDVWWMKDLLAR